MHTSTTHKHTVFKHCTEVTTNETSFAQDLERAVGTWDQSCQNAEKDAALIRVVVGEG